MRKVGRDVWERGPGGSLRNDFKMIGLNRVVIKSNPGFQLRGRAGGPGVIDLDSQKPGADIIRGRGGRRGGGGPGHVPHPATRERPRQPENTRGRSTGQREAGGGGSWGGLGTTPGPPRITQIALPLLATLGPRPAHATEPPRTALDAPTPPPATGVAVQPPGASTGLPGRSKGHGRTQGGHRRP